MVVLADKLRQDLAIVSPPLPTAVYTTRHSTYTRANSGKMARFHFPGKPAKRSARTGGRCQRILSAGLPLSRARLLIAENTRRCLDYFHAIVPEPKKVARWWWWRGGGLGLVCLHIGTAVIFLEMGQLESNHSLQICCCILAYWTSIVIPYHTSRRRCRIVVYYWHKHWSH
jgi:hypothetical protein